jgi:hypothetical protein
MRILNRLRTRTPQPRDAATPDTSSEDGRQAPIPGYDRLDVKQLGVRLTDLSQVELAEVESYERSHQERPAVLDKLRYLRGSEPLPGYDALDSDEVVKKLAGADAQTVKAVRDYERKFQHRQSVLAETARVLPTSQASATETRARERQDALVREGYRGRAKSAGSPANDRSPTDGPEDVDAPAP